MESLESVSPERCLYPIQNIWQFRERKVYPGCLFFPVLKKLGMEMPMACAAGGLQLDSRLAERSSNRNENRSPVFGPRSRNVADGDLIHSLSSTEIPGRLNRVLIRGSCWIPPTCEVIATMISEEDGFVYSEAFFALR